MRVGGYELHLYCDRNELKNGEVEDVHGHRYDEFPRIFTGETGPGCDRQARARGWLVGPHRQLCPKCNRRPARAPLDGEDRG